LWQLNAGDAFVSTGDYRLTMVNGTEWLELLPVAVYTTDADGRITFFNEAAAALWGQRPELGNAQWCGSWRLYWADGRPMAHDECPMAVTLREGRPVRGIEAIAERPDGSRIPFIPFPTPLKDGSGRVTGAINLLIDATDRRHADLQSARLSAIVASSEDAIISKTMEGRVTSWNAAATRLFGYEADEMIGQPIIRIIPPDLLHEEKRIIAQLHRGERIDHYETVRVAKDGSRVEISLSVSPLRDKTGKIVGASKVARDISERRRAEELQRLLIEELNHRVKNTLATVQAIATQSLSHARSPDEFVPGFSGRVQALSRAHDLLTRANLEGADVMELVRDQVLYGSVDDRRVTCFGPKLTLDAQTAVHLGLVLHELATNARKYGALSVPQGRLSVTWEIRTNGGQSLLIAWKESGGPQVVAPRQRGFGSALIERTLKAHGGAAEVRYGSDGVSAEIHLPLPDRSADPLRTRPVPLKNAAALTAGRQNGEAVLTGKRLIVIDDEPLIAMDLESILTGAGCDVIGIASTLAQAKTLVANADCDAALVDVNLSGHSVDELAATLAKRSIPFAFVSGHGREALPRGFQDAVLVRKPFGQDNLLAIVATLVGPGNAVPLRRTPA
jgi:PAS domain S-box-containing protein